MLFTIYFKIKQDFKIFWENRSDLLVTNRITM